MPSDQNTLFPDLYVIIIWIVIKFSKNNSHETFNAGIAAREKENSYRPHDQVRQIAILNSCTVGDLYSVEQPSKCRVVTLLVLSLFKTLKKRIEHHQ